jgi:hypothetical protein
MTRALILLGITALACRDKDPPKPATPGSAAPVAPHTTAPPATHATDERPELPTFGSASGSATATVADRFSSQDVDATWKARTEADLRKHYAKMKHPPAETECRADMCRLTLTGSDEDLAASVDELQSLHDIAQSMMLTRPDPTKVVAYLTFERAD